MAAILPWFFILLCLTNSSLQHSALGQRTLPQLLEEEMLKLATVPDPLKNLDPYDSGSHLSHILIPRVRKSTKLVYLGQLNHEQRAPQTIPLLETISLRL